MRGEWSKLRGKQLKGCQFYRQKIIGNYIADFYCPIPLSLPFIKGEEPKLQSRYLHLRGAGLRVIEVDGGQHYSAEGKEKDKKIDYYMTREGISVLRFSDREVLGNLDAVLEKIWSGL